MGVSDEDLTHLPALELSAAIARREVKSREVVQAFLDRIELLNSEINAVVRVLADEALAQADAADEAEPIGPFHGVPLTVKENIDLAGTPTTNGLPANAELMPTADAPVVERMRRAGAIPIGRTNLPELGLRYDTDNPLHGRTANPWDLTRTPGGSSGGEAAAIASGMSPLGLGNDIAGSLRNPAFCCGIVGFRPTTGRVPLAGSVPPVDPPLSVQLMGTDGPLGLDVASVRAATAVLNGAHPRDPRSVDVAFDRSGPERRVAGLVTRGYRSTTLSDAVAAALSQAADALADAGWEIEELQFPELEQTNEIWMRIMSADIPGLLDNVGHLLTPKLATTLADHVTYYDPDGLPPPVAHQERFRLMRVWSQMFSSTPIVISPIWHEQAFPAGHDLLLGMDFIAERMQFQTPGSLLGLPGVAVPTGLADGLPVGVQVQADRWNDVWCLDAAADIEARLGRIAVVDPG